MIKKKKSNEIESLKIENQRTVFSSNIYLFLCGLRTSQTSKASFNGNKCVRSTTLKKKNRNDGTKMFNFP